VGVVVRAAVNSLWGDVVGPTPLARLAAGTVVAGCVGLVAPLSWAQDVGGAMSKVSIVPRISVSETFTNNVALSNTGKRSELITQVSPGIRFSSTGGRIRGSLDYSLTEQLYANGTSGRRSQNALSATGTMEAVDNWAFVDFSGSIGQQAISAFGAPVGDGSALNSNSTETSVFRLSPYVRGRFGSVADYEARYSISSSSSRSAVVSDVNTRDLSLRLSGVGGRRGVGWNLTGDHQTVDYSAGRSTSSRRINGQLNYPISDRWAAYIKAGYESSDYLDANSQNQDFTAFGVSFTPNDEAQFSIDRDGRGSTGLTIKWAPSRRTSVSVVRERRLFGDAQTISLAYRTSNTAWTFSDTRSTVTSTGLSATAPSLSLYDLLLAQFSAAESDPTRREQYSAFLIANGIRPAATAIGGFLTSALSLQNQRQLSFALFGARSTISLTATRSSNTRLDTVSNAMDDLVNSSVVRQNGLIANYSHRFTPATAINVVAARLTASGTPAQPGTSTTSVNVNLSTRLTKDATASIGARRVIFDSSTAPYTETAVLGNLNVQF
jgi:uncharacterized protein (PEP-CTERM system associated)